MRSSEDCLTVNVLSPAVPRRKRLSISVMVFVHGGGYNTGSAQDFPGQGEGFVSSGRVVYVSLNYQLGALRYLDFSRYSTPDRPIENNLGLRDQVAALEWVRANIRSFGGTFLPEHPFDAFRDGRAHRVPLIIGTNDREGAFFRGRANVLPRSPWRIQALFNHAPEDSHDEMRAAYPGLPISRAAADFGGDYAFWYPSIVVAGLHSRFAPVHFYRFDIAPRLMHLLGLGLDATHGIEMYALFDQVDSPFARTMTALGGREPFSRAGAGPGCTSPAPASSRATRRGIPNQTA